MAEETNMSFLQHLEELRWRLVRSAIAVIIFGTVIWFYQEKIMNEIFLKMVNKDFITFKLLCKFFGVCVGDIPVKMQSMTVSGQFSYALMLSIMGGVVLAFPFIFYQIWSFVKPGLKFTEKKMARGIVFYVSFLFFLGIAFGYFVVAPLSIQFFGTFTMSSQIENIFTINSYMSTVISTVFYTGLFFLLPIVSYFLTKIGLFDAAFLITYRKHAIVAILVLAAIITPPDVLSQVIVSIPILILYEVGIYVAKRVEKNQQNENKS
jgi:sec-independent protein translocase protein TatC